VRLTVRQAPELPRIAARHGALDVRPLPACRALVALERRYVTVTVTLGADGQPTWTRVLTEPEPALSRSSCAGTARRAGR
jgi:hypothetical protein